MALLLCCAAACCWMVETVFPKAVTAAAIMVFVLQASLLSFRNYSTALYMLSELICLCVMASSFSLKIRCSKKPNLNFGIYNMMGGSKQTDIASNQTDATVQTTEPALQKAESRCKTAEAGCKRAESKCNRAESKCKALLSACLVPAQKRSVYC